MKPEKKKVRLMEALTLIFEHQTQGRITPNAKLEDILRSKEADYGHEKSRIEVVKSLDQSDCLILGEKKRKESWSGKNE